MILENDIFYQEFIKYLKLMILTLSYNVFTFYKKLYFYSWHKLYYNDKK